MTRVRVYKVGGPALDDQALVSALARELRDGPGHAVVVHGGGRRIEDTLRALAIESRFVDGRRETSAAAMEVVEMVLSGLINKSLAAGLTRAGTPAVGLSGRDAGLLRARVQAGLGRVGLPERVDPAPLRALWACGLLPVLSPVAAGPDGEALNVNADEAALAVASALSAEALVYLSDVDGVRGASGPVATLSAAEAERLVRDGTIAGGMSLKVRMALAAASAGIPEVTIAGRARLTGGFPGTRITGGTAAEARP
jgi:acetylglutamate kinase